MEERNKIKKYLAIQKHRETILDSIRRKIGLQIQKRIAIERQIQRCMDEVFHMDRVYEQSTFYEALDISTFFKRKIFLKMSIQDLRESLAKELRIEQEMMKELLLANQQLEIIKKLIEKLQKSIRIQMDRKEQEVEDDFLNNYKSGTKMEGF